jgi:hypothetical protein
MDAAADRFFCPVCGIGPYPRTSLWRHRNRAHPEYARRRVGGVDDILLGHDEYGFPDPDEMSVDEFVEGDDEQHDVGGGAPMADAGGGASSGQLNVAGVHGEDARAGSVELVSERIGGQSEYGGGQSEYGGGQSEYGGGQAEYGGGQSEYGGGQSEYTVGRSMSTRKGSVSLLVAPW